MPYNREEASHTSFVQRIVGKAKGEYLKSIEKTLTDFYNNKKQAGVPFNKPAVINEPPTDVNDKYILYQDLNTLEYLQSIDFDAGVCNMIVSAPHERKLANPIRAQQVINTRFEQADQILTAEDMEAILAQKEEGWGKDTDDIVENKDFG